MLSSFRHFDVVQEVVEPNLCIVTKLYRDFYQILSWLRNHIPVFINRRKIHYVLCLTRLGSSLKDFC